MRPPVELLEEPVEPLCRDSRPGIVHGDPLRVFWSPPPRAQSADQGFRGRPCNAVDSRLTLWAWATSKNTGEGQGRNEDIQSRHRADAGRNTFWRCAGAQARSDQGKRVGSGADDATQDTSASCPITKPSDSSFVPPAPYPTEAPSGGFFFGTPKLWLSSGGIGRARPTAGTRPSGGARDSTVKRIPSQSC